MALPVVPIAYGVIRGLLARYGSKQGVQTLMRELGVNQRTASKIMETYRKVGKKGDITQKLGGKDVVSNRNVINVQLGSKDAAQATILKNNPLLTRGGAGQKANLLGNNTLNPTAGSRMYPQGTGQGLLSTVNQGIRTGANATGRGLLATGRFAGSPSGIGLGILGTGAYAAIPDENAGLNQPGRDAYYDRQGNLVMRDGTNTTGSYQDRIKSGEIVPKITKQSYEEFKKQKDIFNNTNVPTRSQVVEKLIPYIHDETAKGAQLNHIMRHTVGLFHGQNGSRSWKQYLSKNMCIRDADIQKVNHIMDQVKKTNPISLES